MTDKRVTAIISAYYCDQYLDGRIKNLLEQDENLAIIAIAKKDSKEVAILADCPQVEVILTDDVPGIYEAWNLGIRSSKTKYVTNANSDDRLVPCALKKMADILDKESTYGVVYSNVNIVKEIDGVPVGRYTWKEGGLAELMRGCFLGPMPMWKKTLHDRYGYFDEEYKSAGDYEFWLRLASNGVKFYHIRDEVMGTYLWREKSIEHREPLRTLWEANHARMKYRKVAT